MFADSKLRLRPALFLSPGRWFPQKHSTPYCRPAKMKPERRQWSTHLANSSSVLSPLLANSSSPEESLVLHHPGAPDLGLQLEAVVEELR